MLTCWPKPTNRKLISAHKLEGNHDWRVCRVCSGVAFSATHPRRWQTRFTFVSTIMPSSPLKQLLNFNCLWLRPFVFLMTRSRVVTWHCLAWPNNMFDKMTSNKCKPISRTRKTMKISSTLMAPTWYYCSILHMAPHVPWINKRKEGQLTCQKPQRAQGVQLLVQHQAASSAWHNYFWSISLCFSLRNIMVRKEHKTCTLAF